MHFQDAQFLCSYGLSSQLPESTRLEFVFSGRSNVGKSSLINKLFHRKSLAKVSSVPGKTATINFYEVGEIYFVDLPGYGYAKVAKSEKLRWASLMEKYFEKPRNIGFVIQLLDMRHPPTKLDLEMLGYLSESKIPFVVALTKADKLNKTQTKQRLEAFSEEIPNAKDLALVACSTQTAQGMDALREMIAKTVQKNTVEE